MAFLAMIRDEPYVFDNREQFKVFARSSGMHPTAINRVQLQEMPRGEADAIVGDFEASKYPSSLGVTPPNAWETPPPPQQQEDLTFFDAVTGNRPLDYVRNPNEFNLKDEVALAEQQRVQAENADRLSKKYWPKFNGESYPNYSAAQAARTRAQDQLSADAEQEIIDREVRGGGLGTMPQNIAPAPPAPIAPAQNTRPPVVEMGQPADPTIARDSSGQYIRTGSGGFLRTIDYDNPVKEAWEF
jgi:hypothetical protein